MTTEQVKEAMAEGARATASQYNYTISRAHDWQHDTQRHYRRTAEKVGMRRYSTQLLAIEGGGNEQQYKAPTQRYEQVQTDSDVDSDPQNQLNH